MDHESSTGTGTGHDTLITSQDSAWAADEETQDPEELRVIFSALDSFS